MSDRDVNIVLQVRVLVEKPPDVVVTVDPGRVKERVRRPWRLRRGSDGERVLDILESSGDDGLSEMELVDKMRERGRLLEVKDAIRSVHWILYNLERRSQAVRRDASGRWRLVAPIARDSDAKGGS